MHTCLSDCFELRYTCYPPSVNLEKGGFENSTAVRGASDARAII